MPRQPLRANTGLMHRRKLHLYSSPARVTAEHEIEHPCYIRVRQSAASAVAPGVIASQESERGGRQART